MHVESFKASERTGMKAKLTHTVKKINLEMTIEHLKKLRRLHVYHRDADMRKPKPSIRVVQLVRQVLLGLNQGLY